MRILLLLTVLLTACSSTGVVPTDGDNYMIAKKSAEFGLGPPIKAQASVYAEANEFCGDDSVETVNLNVRNAVFGRQGSVNLEFRCIDKVASSSSTSINSDAEMGKANTVSESSDQSRLLNDRYADLERLKRLLDDGTLTQEEFDSEKAKVLSE